MDFILSIIQAILAFVGMIFPNLKSLFDLIAGFFS